MTRLSGCRAERRGDTILLSDAGWLRAPESEALLNEWGGVVVSLEDGLNELQARRARALQPDEAKQAARSAKGLGAVRDRIHNLLDQGSFFEVGLLNHSDVEGMEEKTSADGKVCGFGAIDGRTVAIGADDATVLAGSGGRTGGKKTRRLMESAIAKGYPIVNLGEGGGARIPDIMDSDGLSSMTIGQSAGLRMRQVPMVATIMGECFGAPSWWAALSDLVIQVKGSCMAVSGPRVLEMATGEKVDLETLGGWRLHAETTGQVDRVAEDEGEALALVREFLSYLPSNAKSLPPARHDNDGDARDRQQKLLSILPEESFRTYDMREIIRVLVDHQAVFELKPKFDLSVITCLARIGGRVVGIIANQPKHLAGAMGPDGCDKCTSFICLCDSFHIPMIFLHDTPGFMVGRAAEEKRMPGKIINFIEALSLSSVPKISIIIRKSYGMAYGNMCGPGMGAEWQFAWPSADISFVAPEVAANIVHGRKILEAEDPEAAREDAIETMRLGSAPWKAAGVGYLDDVIHPEETRATILRCLALSAGADGAGQFSQRRLAAWPTTF